ncbi:hypothetical protein IDH50_18200 [Aeromicrobium tamlense]|uniref:Uncharacterized protein n=1 Tax=Aeromicrobium tamlense TaxID=375541 RepID=A0A8I0KK69_9ACTN|nr:MULTISPECIES: hypothetical protein [Aeromicrobium]MBD1272182.1 hypothetical protein [Aeromicrobium tamlense]NYI38622.1 hypothetical protein [Aeromicrobium tamlense]
MPKPPKKKCCVSKPRCKRCPIRMMADGTLPDGYTVKKRKLVKVKKDKKKDKKSSKSSKTKAKPLAA